jgi:hypothetical protein
MVFGLGANGAIDSVQVLWPNDKIETIKSVKSDQTITLKQENAKEIFHFFEAKQTPLFADVTSGLLDYLHVESRFNDYDRDVLLKQKYSTQGPALAIGDVNGDGLEDIYLGGAAGQIKKLFIQKAGGKFVDSPQADFSLDQTTENTDAIFFDADKDGDLDLFVVTGSNEFEENAAELHDLLYLNDGKGNLKRDVRFPMIYENGSSVSAADYDKDGDIDLFVGTRMVNAKYGQSAQSNLFINDGTGGFKNQSKRYMPQVTDLGMVTDSEWSDVNGDGYLDLVVTQDWGPVVVFKNERGRKLTKQESVAGSEGLWSCAKPADIDGDGDVDFVLGNFGLNSKLKASSEAPAYLHVGDFDKNGAIEQIISCVTEDGNTYPMVLKGEMQRALPMIKKKFIKYKDYANKTVEELFTDEQREGVTVRQIQTTSSSFMINDGKGNFTFQALPYQAQFSPIHAIQTGDFNKDGKLDILLAGNFFDSLPEWGRFDANYGLLLEGQGKGKFAVKLSKQTGFKTLGQVRNMALVKGGKSTYVVLAKNDEKAQVFKF